MPLTSVTAAAVASGLLAADALACAVVLAGSACGVAVAGATLAASAGVSAAVSVFGLQPATLNARPRSRLANGRLIEDVGRRCGMAGWCRLKGCGRCHVGFTGEIMPHSAHYIQCQQVCCFDFSLLFVAWLAKFF